MTLNYPGVSIDHRVATFNGITYSLAGINSVTVRVGNGLSGCAMLIGLCAVVGAFALLFGGESFGSKALNFAVGLLLAAGLFWLSTQLKPTYAIVLGLGAGEEIVYSTKDKATADRIEEAVKAGMT